MSETTGSRLAGLLAGAAVLAFLGMPVAARAGDDEKKPIPAGECKDPPKEAPKDKEACKDEDKAGCKCCKDGGCADCKDGEGACSAESTVTRQLRDVASALLEEGSAAAKAAAASLPAEAAKKVEQARTVAKETIAKVKKAAADARADFDAAAANAKAEGKAASCEAGAVFENDLKALKQKYVAALDAFGTVVADALGKDRVASVAAEVGKAREAAKAALSKAAEAVKKAVSSDTVTYRCGCNGKTWTQAATATKACPYCGDAMPECGEKVEPEAKPEPKPEPRPETKGETPPTAK